MSKIKYNKLELSSARQMFYPHRTSGQAMPWSRASSLLFPPVLAFIFIGHLQGIPTFQLFFMLFDFHRILLTQALVFAARQCLR